MFSGIYPHLAHTNREREVGIGAVVSWAGSLWTNTYGPHLPYGSSDKLRQIDSDWNVTIRPESVGGTPANRMIHPESQQLIIGHHLIDRDGKVRTIDPNKAMPGRLTANAHHLTDPENRVYYLTMENGVYEVDVNSLDVTVIVDDPINISKTFLPGYHGKGAYTGSERVVVSNNGEPNQTYPSGCLATWDGQAWTIVARNQFTEVTGPGGLSGNRSDDDRVWAVGWDRLSVRLFLLQDGQWKKFRLPKGSYTHDANHGWNTEWPRIRQVKSDLTLMHMHGLFYRFPQSFSKTNCGGISPICTYVKMPVDYEWFNGKLVIGKDDASKFDNAFVQQAQSNLWIGDVDDLSTWGPVSGFGGVWLNEDFDAGEISEPFLINGFERVCLHVEHRGGFDLPIEIQIDREGDGNWILARSLMVEKKTGAAFVVLSGLDAQWVRLVCNGAANDVTAYFQLSSAFQQRHSSGLFEGLANVSKDRPAGGSLQLPIGDDMKLNVFNDLGQVQIDGDLRVHKVESTAADLKTRQQIAIEADSRVGVDEASAFVNLKEANNGWVKLRLPKGAARFDATVGKVRHIREVVTERTMLNLHGTFYELPRPKPGKFLNFRQMKPISSHGKHIHDFCSWRGMLVLSGASPDHDSNNVVRAGSTAVWLGEVDDLWKFGKPVGTGGPWLNTVVKKGAASDPYLILGYEEKTISIQHTSESPIEFSIEVDAMGTGRFVEYFEIKVDAGDEFVHTFPKGFAAHWIRVVPGADTTATAQLDYR